MTRDETLKKEMQLAERFFGTADDPDQMPITWDSVKKLDALCEGWLETEFDERGEPISWAVVMPTQRALVERFLNNEISERELLDQTKPEKIYEAVYLISVITIPEHQRKGLAHRVLMRATQNMPVTDDAVYVAWPTTPEGKKLVEKVESGLRKKIILRE